MKQGEYNQFRFVGMNQSGQKRSGVVVARNSRDVVRYLHARNVIPIKIVRSSFVVSLLRSAYYKVCGLFRSKKRLKYQLFGQFGDLLATNFTLIDIVENLCGTVKQAEVKFAFHKVLLDLKSGYSLTFALTRHFSYLITPIELNLIGHAEPKRKLDLAFQGLKENMLKQLQSGGKSIVRLMPIIAAFLGAIVIIGNTLAYYQPRIEWDMYMTRQQLPDATSLLFLIFRGGVVLKSTIFFTAGFVFFMLAKHLVKLFHLKNQIDVLVLKVPYVKESVRLKNLVQFIMVLSLSIKSHVPLQIAVKDAVAMIVNYKYRTEMENIVDTIYDGFDVTNELLRASLFSESDILLLESAIKSGNLEKDAESLMEFANIKLKLMQLINFNLIKYGLIFTLAFLLILTFTAIFELYTMYAA